MLWQELYIACVLETNSEKLKALIHETENAISRVYKLWKPPMTSTRRSRVPQPLCSS